MGVTKSKGFIREETLRILRGSADGWADVFWIARFLEGKYKRKPGSCHLAVKKVMRVLEREGLIYISGPKDQYDTYKLKLLEKKE